MEITAEKVIQLMNQIAPPDLAESWDHPGLQVGDPGQKVKRILVSLDVTPDNVKWAAANHIDMIVSHHPFLFKGTHRLDLSTERGTIIQELITHHIVSFAAHTNLDTARGGVNDVLASALGLKNTEGLVFVGKDEAGDEYMGRIGELDHDLDGLEALQYIKEKLRIPFLRYAGNINRKVRRIAVLGGAGSEFTNLAREKGADLYLTGDVKYHEAQDAAYSGILLADGGHFYTERVIIHALADKLRKQEWDAEVFEDPKAEDIFHYLA